MEVCVCVCMCVYVCMCVCVCVSACARVCNKTGATYLVKHADACVQEKGHMGTEVLVMLIRHFGK